MNYDNGYLLDSNSTISRSIRLNMDNYDIIFYNDWNGLYSNENMIVDWFFIDFYLFLFDNELIISFIFYFPLNSIDFHLWMNNLYFIIYLIDIYIQ